MPSLTPTSPPTLALELPTVTLANHTAVLTGLHPGHHGILHNAWWDKNDLRQVITNSPATWHEAASWLFPGVETIHDAVHRSWPGDCSVSINEPTDAGADFSTFDFVRRGVALERPPGPDDLPNATERFVRPEKSYEISSRIDHTGMTQALEVWEGGGQLPRYCFVNFTLTDAAFHHSGPYAEIARANTASPMADVGTPRPVAFCTVQTPVPLEPAASRMTSTSGSPVSASRWPSTSAVISMR